MVNEVDVVQLFTSFIVIENTPAANALADEALPPLGDQV